MAIISKMHSVSATCKDYVHPWCDSCVSASLDLLPVAAKESFRIYCIAYSVALLMRGKVPSKNEIKRTIFGILQSTLFLIVHSIGFPSSLCLMRRILGRFYFLTVAFIPKFLVSILAISVERKSRRALLCLYVTNVATETVFRMAVSRNLVKPLPYGEILIFAVSVSYLLYCYKGLGLPKDPIYSLLRFLVGPYEERGYYKMDESPYPPKKYPISNDQHILVQYYLMAKSKWSYFIYKLKTLSSHPSCPHPYSCLHYVLTDSIKKFSVGYGLYLVLKLAMSFKRIITNPLLIKRTLFKKDNLRLGICFGLFSALFKGVSCLMRRGLGTDSDLNAVPAGFLAGLAFYFYRDNAIALYFMWKAVQISYSLGVEKGLLPEIPYASILFYALSTATLFHVAMVEPYNLRPSYWKFLEGMSGGRIRRMDRKCIDEFGLKTSESLAKVLAGTKYAIKPIEIRKLS